MIAEFGYGKTTALLDAGATAEVRIRALLQDSGTPGYLASESKKFAPDQVSLSRSPVVERRMDEIYETGKPSLDL